MTPYYADPWLTVYEGDCRAVLASLPAESVHTVVTSPPYWGLRDYGTATWSGGDAACDHRLDADTAHRQNAARSTLGGGKATQIAAAEGRHHCRCGATRVDSQLGLEPTPEEYVANMVAVFREVRRVLRADGTLWLNLGDSYASAQAGATDGTVYARRQGEFLTSQAAAHGATHAARNRNGTPVPSGLKPKDLVGIPWRVAFALQADGWYLRSDIIWAKPNPMPESVTDRPTKAHEYLFLLSKSPRYYYDADAIAEQAADTSIARWRQNVDDQAGSDRVPGKTNGTMRAVGGKYRAQARRAVELAHQAGLTEAHIAAIRAVGITDAGKAQMTQDGFGRNDPDVQALAAEAKAALGGYFREFLIAEDRNARTVWTIPTSPYKAKHFATFPPELPERCIKAGCPELGTVLDPFAGSGTTGMVAQSLSRRAVLIDLNGEYLTQAMARNRDIPLGLDVA
jgi:DNA modification methylase